MTRNVNEIIKAMPKARQQKIKTRAKELIAEEATLQEMRKGLKRSQAQVAAKLGINQAAVSKLERRGDILVSTLRDYVEGMGGELEIIAKFPEGKMLKINQFEGLV